MGRVWGNFFKKLKEETKSIQTKYGIYDCRGGSLNDRVEIDFNSIPPNSIPELKIVEYNNGSAEIKMGTNIIPSLCKIYKNTCEAKKAILKWIEQQEPNKVVNTITIGGGKPKFTPPPGND